MIPVVTAAGRYIYEYIRGLLETVFCNTYSKQHMLGYTRQAILYGQDFMKTVRTRQLIRPEIIVADNRHIIGRGARAIP